MRSKDSKLQEIAAKANVSVSTVSIVLNNRGDQLRIAKATQERIHKIAKEVDYTPNIYARKLRKSAKNGANKVVGVFWSLNILDESLGYFFSSANKEIVDNQYRIEFSIHFFQPGHLGEVEELQDPWRFNGLIFFGLRTEDARLLESYHMDIPVVISNKLPEGLINCLYLDNEDVGHRAAIALGQRHYRRVGIVRPVQANSGALLRGGAFAQAATELGMTYRPEWCVEMDDSSFAAACRGIDTLLSLPEHPDALMFTSYSCSLNAAIAVNRWIERTGEDCALLFCCYDANIEALVDNVGMIDLSIRKYAVESTRLLWQLMNGQTEGPVRRAMPPEEILRKLKKKTET